MSKDQNSTREYVETYVNEASKDIENYLSEQQPKYDSSKSFATLPTKPAQDESVEQSSTPSSSQRHRPTLNPIPTSDESQQQEPQLVWASRDFVEQRNEIHEAALINCAELHSELMTCFKDGSWWDKAKLCENQKQKFWKCYHSQKTFLKKANYKGPISTPEDDASILYKAMKLVDS